MNGFVKLHRQLIEWEWYSEMKVKTVFLHLLLTANFKDANWRGQGIKRGQLITSYPSLSKALKLSVQEIRTTFKKLKSTNNINWKPTGKNLLITVVNFDVFQQKEIDSNRESTGNQQDSNTELTGNQQQRKNDKKEKNKEEDSFDKRINKNLPFDVVTSAETINAIYQDTSVAIEQVKNIFAITATSEDVKEAQFTFSTVAIASYDRYKGIRTTEKLKNKFIDWIPKSIKFQGSAPSNGNPKENLNLETHILSHYKAVELKHYKLQGKFDRWNAELKENSFRLGNIAKGYKNKSFTTLFVFEACYMPLGNRLGGSSPKRKLEALVNWYKKLSDYNQNQGDMRKLFKDWGKAQSL